MSVPVKVIVARPGKRTNSSLDDKIWAIAQPRKAVNGQIVLDRNDPSDNEWFEDKKIGSIFNK
ncbi:hypothetical protein [Anaerospora hongkongensis]|uniref:hypothetical protein n=1 Tax=Anaerospora hongkongensis TaxID=244830 RepID=UPI00289F76BC|nr:hypothetical protein [Anaerospora hongkongensis]